MRLELVERARQQFLSVDIEDQPGLVGTDCKFLKLSFAGVNDDTLVFQLKNCGADRQTSQLK